MSNLKLLIFIMAVSNFLGLFAAHAQSNEQWKILKFSGIKKNEYVIHENGIIDIHMDDSSSLLYRKISETEKEAAFLSWQWKIALGFAATSMTDKTKDDRPVAIHIWFPKEKTDKNKGFKEFFGRLFGYDFPGRVITYVWGGTEKQGEIIENPHFEERGFLIVQKPGTFVSDAWIDEQVNFRADYKKIFGEDAPDPTHVAISGDSDHSHVIAMSSVQMIKFSDTAISTGNLSLDVK